MAPYARLALGFLLLACPRRSEPNPERSEALGAGGSAEAALPVSPARPAAVNTLDRAAVTAFVKRWAQAQNDLDFAAYEALYAADFVGTKRVGERATTFDRAGWLADRKRMFATDMRVTVADLELLRSDAGVSVLFEQRWSTSTFADRGPKRLLLRKRETSFEIVREEMLASKLLGAEDRGGACSAGLQRISDAAPEVRYFADLAPHMVGARWAAVASAEEANERADDGTAWEVWALVSSEGWHAAELSKTSPSGDWFRESSYCFRPDGTLQQMTDSHVTFYSEHGVVKDTVSATYDLTATPISTKSEAHYMETGKKAAAGTYQRPPPIVVGRLGELPFHALVAP